MESQEHRKKAAYSPNLLFFLSSSPLHLESESANERVGRSEHGNLMKNGKTFLFIDPVPRLGRGKPRRFSGKELLCLHGLV
jgi:hypothetical protein